MSTIPPDQKIPAEVLARRVGFVIDFLITGVRYWDPSGQARLRYWERLDRPQGELSAAHA